MYLFSTFNNNTNFILNKKKEYKELVYKAECELNTELDRIKKGNVIQSNSSRMQLKSENMVISKRIDNIDPGRKIYMVTVDAQKGGESVSVKGYERVDCVNEIE